MGNVFARGNASSRQLHSQVEETAPPKRKALTTTNRCLGERQREEGGPNSLGSSPADADGGASVNGSAPEWNEAGGETDMNGRRRRRERLPPTPAFLFAEPPILSAASAPPLQKAKPPVPLFHETPPSVMWGGARGQIGGTLTTQTPTTE